MKKRKKSVTIVDIAKELGVSVTLVSMVLSGKGAENRISKKASEKVVATAKKLGYKPNQIARALRTGKSSILGLLVADISNPFFSQIARLIENEAGKYEYHVMFASSDENPEKFKKLGNALISRQVDGMIIVPVMDSRDIIAGWQSQGIPMVAIDRYFSSLNLPCAVTDNYDASLQMLKLIIDKGYRKIAFIGKNTDLTSFTDREDGFIEGTKRFNLSPGQFSVIKLNYHHWENEIRDIIIRLIREGYDNIFFSQNMIGMEGLRIINELKVRIPEDVSVISFDNPAVFEFNKPPVTCLEQQLDRIAEWALSSISKIINNESDGRIACKKYKGRLIIRESC